MKKLLKASFFATLLALLVLGGISTLGARTVSAQKIQSCPTTQEEAAEVFGALPQNWESIKVPVGGCGWALNSQQVVNIFVPTGWIFLEMENPQWPPSRWEGPLSIMTYQGELWLGEKPQSQLYLPIVGK